jgi:hypothetical protein
MIRLIVEGTRHGDIHLRDRKPHHSEQEELSSCGKRMEAACLGGEG